MKILTVSSTYRYAVASTAILLAGLAGCKSTPKVVDDATLAANVHTALTSDSTIASQPIQSSVQNGTVTLNGNVSDDTARLVAAEDAAKVTGVRTVVNNLTIQGVQLPPTITTAEAPTAPRVATKQERQIIARHEPLPTPPPAPVSSPAPSAPAPPPAPVYRDITVPAGTGISVRITQTLDSESTQEGASFSGVVTSSVIVDGETAIPAGSGVSGRVVGAHEAGHYKGNSMLSIELTSISRRGQRIAVNSEPYTVEGKGRGKNTAAKVGGGAAVGAILGGILGGGKGAAIGAGVGGGGGAVLNGVTRGQQVQINSESVIRFRLSNSFSVRSYGRSYDRDDDDSRDNGGLQQRPRNY